MLLSYFKFSNCLVAKFGAKIYILKFETKNAWYGYFWTGILKKLLPYLKSAPSNLSNYKILWKMIMLTFGIKNALFWYFWDWVLNILLPYFKSAPSDFPNSKILRKKNVKIWDQKWLIWVFLGWNLKTNILIFEISFLEFALQ